MSLFRIIAHFYQLPAGELDCKIFLPGDTRGRGSQYNNSAEQFLDSWELDLNDLSFTAKTIARTVFMHISSEAKMKKAAAIVLSLYKKGYTQGQRRRISP